MHWGKGGPDEYSPRKPKKTGWVVQLNSALAAIQQLTSITHVHTHTHTHAHAHTHTHATAGEDFSTQEVSPTARTLNGLRRNSPI